MGRFWQTWQPRRCDEIVPNAQFSILGGNENNRARFRSGQLRENFRHQWKSVGQHVARSLQNDNCQLCSLKVQLAHHLAVHRDENLETILSPLEQFTVANSGPANQRHGFDFVAREMAFEPPIQILVEQNFQIRLARALAV